MFAPLGRFVVKYAWYVIGAWIVAAVAIVALAPKLTSTSDEAAFLPTHYESIKAINIQEKAFPNAAAPDAIIVIDRQDGAPLTEADEAHIKTITDGLRAKTVSTEPGKPAAIENVLAVAPPQPSPHRLVSMTMLQMVKMTGPSDKRQTNAVSDLRKALKQELSTPDGAGLQGGITGNAAQQLDSEESGSKAEAIIGLATIGLILILLLVIFRSPVIALLPIITIGVVSQVANGLIAWASKAFDLKVDSSVTSILIVVLFGVGTDYILFLMFRYRERLRLGEDPKTAMVNAIERVGEAIASAAGAVIIAFLALTLSTLGLFKALGPALAIAVGTTLVAGLTLIPAVVSLLGTRVFWPSKAWKEEPKGAKFAAVGAAMGKRPAVFAGVSGLVLVALAIAALGFHPNFDLGAGSTSASAESTVYQKALLRDVPAGATQPSDVYLQSSGDKLTEPQLAEYHKALAGVPGVGSVGEPKLSADGLVADFPVTLSSGAESSAAIATVKGPLRDVAHSAAPPGMSACVGGITSVFVDIQAATDHDYAIVFPVAAILIMIILGVMLRSIVAPLYLMASVGLGFAATLGATVIVFQQFKGEPGLIFMLPVIMYMFVVALGTDYNILMISRLREEAQEGRSPRDAAAEAVKHAGPTVAAAGVILAGTFASMMLAGNATLSQMGFAISVGIAIAAFIMAMFFTPALTALIGHAAWWPGHGDEAKHASGDEPDQQVVLTK